MRELKNSASKGEYSPPVVIRLGSSADITAGGPAANADGGDLTDTAFANPGESS